MKIQPRWQSKVLWASIVAQVVVILVMTGVIDLAQGEFVNQVATALLQLLVLFGVINNPTNPEGL